MIDAHHHFWTTSRDDYGWLTPDDAVLYRDFGPAEFAPLIDGAGISQTVSVQAAPTLAETRYLLEIADRTDWVAAVVGWAPLDDERVCEVLDHFAVHSKLVGVRPMIQDIADDDWMLGEAVGRGLRALVERSLTLDALVHPRHLTRLGALLARHPDLRVVIDHAAKPGIRSNAFDTWAHDIAQIAGDSDAYCKLSGLVTEASADWQVNDLRRYVDHLLACFGPSRLMWGSDWPVVELAGGFARWRETTLELVSALGLDERMAILGGSAERFYGLAPKVAYQPDSKPEPELESRPHEQSRTAGE